MSAQPGNQLARKHGQTRKDGFRSWEYRLWRSAQTRAAYQELPFDLEIADIVIPKFCPVFPEIELRPGNDDSRATVDRLIPSLGYVKGNVRVISMHANRLKNNATVQELRRIADWLEQELATTVL